MMAANGKRRPTPPHLTNHAAIRWEERTQDARPDDIWTAWVDAVPVDLPHPWTPGDDEARYHHDERVLLVRSGSQLVTVFDLTGKDSHPAARRAVEQQLDVDLETHR